MTSDIQKSSFCIILACLQQRNVSRLGEVFAAVCLENSANLLKNSFLNIDEIKIFSFTKRKEKSPVFVTVYDLFSVCI